MMLLIDDLIEELQKKLQAVTSPEKTAGDTLEDLKKQTAELPNKMAQDAVKDLPKDTISPNKGENGILSVLGRATGMNQFYDPFKNPDNTISDSVLQALKLNQYTDPFKGGAGSSPTPSAAGGNPTVGPLDPNYTGGSKATGDGTVPVDGGFTFNPQTGFADKRSGFTKTAEGIGSILGLVPNIGTGMKKMSAQYLMNKQLQEQADSAAQGRSREADFSKELLQDKHNEAMALLDMQQQNATSELEKAHIQAQKDAEDVRFKHDQEAADAAVKRNLGAVVPLRVETERGERLVNPALYQSNIDAAVAKNRASQRYANSFGDSFRLNAGEGLISPSGDLTALAGGDRTTVHTKRYDKDGNEIDTTSLTQDPLSLTNTKRNREVFERLAKKKAERGDLIGPPAPSAIQSAMPSASPAQMGLPAWMNNPNYLRSVESLKKNMPDIGTALGNATPQGVVPLLKSYLDKYQKSVANSGVAGDPDNYVIPQSITNAPRSSYSGVMGIAVPSQSSTVSPNPMSLKARSDALSNANISGGKIKQILDLLKVITDAQNQPSTSY